MSFGVDRPEVLWLLLLAIPIGIFAVASRRHLSPVRRLVAVGVRLVLLGVLVLAAAGLTRNEAVDAVAVVFAIDRSASIDAAGQRTARDFVRAALAHQAPGDRVGIVVFGADALVEIEPVEALHLTDLESAPDPHQTDLAGGLRLASALLPADRTGRIVVLTDGEETRGDAGAQALLMAGDDVEIATVALEGRSGPDALLDDLLAPARVDEGAAYEVRVVARSTVPTTGRLRLYRNEVYLGETAVALSGERADVFAFRQEATEAGLLRYRAVLEVDDPAADVVPQNNRVVATVQVAGRARLLYVSGAAGPSPHLVTALRGEGIDVVAAAPEDLPAGLSGLRPYAAVFLSDVPAYLMTTRQQEALQRFVRDLGRGLVMIGGEHAFGLGGYYRTPIEEALPVRMDIQDRTRFPKLAMAIALDKSCSMGDGPGSKLGMAREAGILTAELLSERDLLGVIGFDSAAAWIVPLTPMTDRAHVIDTIASLRSGGGTDIYPALDRAFRGLRASDAALRHAIVLSDGMTAPADFRGLITGAAEDGITVSAIAIGTDADRATMRDFAAWGGGEYYLVTDPAAIPAIFTRETMLASRSFLVEEPVRAVFGAPSDLLAGLSPGDFPVFQGYVATEAKPRSVVALTVDDPEFPAPLLAHWRYGLGRAVAFTSDDRPRWSGRWVDTSEYTRFWTQVARWAVGTGDDEALDVVAEIVDGALVVTVDAYDPGGGFRNFLDGRARVVAPDLTVRQLPLEQVAPGRYRATSPVDQDGSWLVGVQLLQEGEIVGQAVAEAVQPYSPEFRARGAGRALVQELGRLGGGGVLTDPARVFARPPHPREIPRPVWPWLLALAPFLLLVDVAARRLAFGGPRTRAVRESAVGALAARHVAPSRPKPHSGPSGIPGSGAEIPPEVEVPEAGTPEAGAPETDGPEVETYAGRLLEARRKARRRFEEP